MLTSRSITSLTLGSVTAAEIEAVARLDQHLRVLRVLNLESTDLAPFATSRLSGLCGLEELAVSSLSVVNLPVFSFGYA